MKVIDIVNDNDEVIDTVLREAVEDENRSHRHAHVLVFNDGGKLALQMRSDRVRNFPFHWMTSASGHVDSGENYEQAAYREMEEEIGLKTEIKFLAKYSYQRTSIMRLFLGVFQANSNGPFTLNKEEVKDLNFFSLNEIKAMRDRGEKFHPDLLAILTEHFKI